MTRTKIIKPTLIFLVMVPLWWLNAINAFAAEDPTEPPGGEVLCVPEVYAPVPAGCNGAGPTKYLKRMASAGIELPLRQLPATQPERGLVDLNYTYARVVSNDAPIYRTLEAAVKRSRERRILESGFDFISYIEIAEVKNAKYYRLRSGEWMYGGDLSRISAPRFQGLLLHRTPRNQFGWVLHPTETKRTPGYHDKNYTGHRLKRYDLVQIYTVERVDDLDWFLVGPDEWVEQRQIGRVIPNPNPPTGVTNGRWIEINLYEQTLAVYDQHRLVYATLVSSGLPGWWTQPGLFQIYVKLEADTMRGAFLPDRTDFYYLEDVPWTMYFDQARALHGAYWHNGFGYPRSHGCVNLAPGDAHWIYRWARDGDWVYVWDPSGRTPADPDEYSDGGA